MCKGEESGKKNDNVIDEKKNTLFETHYTFILYTRYTAIGKTGAHLSTASRWFLSPFFFIIFIFYFFFIVATLLSQTVMGGGARVCVGGLEV